MIEFYQEVLPKDAHLFFTKEMIDIQKKAVFTQIVTNENRNLESGQGIFILDELNLKGHGSLNVAIHAMWKWDPKNGKFSVFDVLKYYIYSGEGLPDQLLDAINDLQAGGDAEWKYPKS